MCVKVRVVCACLHVHPVSVCKQHLGTREKLLSLRFPGDYDEHERHENRSRKQKSKDTQVKDIFRMGNIKKRKQTVFCQNLPFVDLFHDLIFPPKKHPFKKNNLQGRKQNVNTLLSTSLLFCSFFLLSSCEPYSVANHDLLEGMRRTE